MLQALRERLPIALPYGEPMPAATPFRPPDPTRYASHSGGYTGASTRWVVCFLLFLATTVNYMDRSVLSLIEPLLHTLPFMGWDPHHDQAHQAVFNNNYKHIVQCFQLAYGLGLLTAGRLIDKLGTKIGYAIAITVWALSSMGHALVFSVTGFCVARFLLGLGESGNFPAAIKAITEWFPSEERGLATGLFNSGSNVSFFVAPAIVIWATGHFGWQAGFLATGSMGLLWLVLWLVFPYDRLRRQQRPDDATVTQVNISHVVAPGLSGWPLYRRLLRNPGLYAFSIGKFLTDPIWWFYLFYLPKFLNETYGLDLKHAYREIVIVYVISSFGSVGGGGLSGWLMRRGHTVNYGRKVAMLVMAVGVVPIVIVPHFGHLFPGNAWPATLVIAVAAAAHQGWSANIFSTPPDMFPSRAVSTVVGIGGAVGSLGGVIFTGIVGSYFSLHPMVIFGFGACSYLLALGIFQLLVPRLGPPSEAEIPLSVT